MILEFNKNGLIARKYHLKCKEIVKMNGKTIEEDSSILSVGLTFDGREIGYLTLDYIKESKGEIENVMEISNNIFEDLKYKLNNHGSIKEIINLPVIKEKWQNLKRTGSFEKYKKREDIRELIFNISKLLNNEEQMTETLQNYSILPYLFLGIYNQNINETTPLIIEKSYYNAFPLDKIPMICEVYGNEIENGKKQIMMSGKHYSNFDRFSYIDNVRAKFPEEGKYLQDSLNTEIKSITIYNNENIIDLFQLLFSVNISDIFDYTIQFSLEENETGDEVND